MDCVAPLFRTCFWAGDTFAPKLKITTRNGCQVSVQQYLQGAYLNMFDVVVSQLGDLEGILGFEVFGHINNLGFFYKIFQQIMNEPHRGYVDTLLSRFEYNRELHLSYIRTFHRLRCLAITDPFFKQHPHSSHSCSALVIPH